MRLTQRRLKNLVRSSWGWVIGISMMVQLPSGCDYARMNDDEAINTYQTAFPNMPEKAIPLTGGIQILRGADPEKLKNPIPFSAESVELGKERYGFYCIQCHGPNADGYGTVGQSFAPLPTNLKDSYVQEQEDGELFYKISLGFNRHPPLWATTTEQERWAIIDYIRSLVKLDRG